MKTLPRATRTPIDQAPAFKEAAIEKSQYFLDRLFGPKDHAQELRLFAANVLLCTCPARTEFDSRNLTLVTITPVTPDFEAVDNGAQIILNTLAEGTGGVFNSKNGDNSSMEYDPKTGLHLETSGYPIWSGDAVVTVERIARHLHGKLADINYDAEIFS